MEDPTESTSRNKTEVTKMREYEVALIDASGHSIGTDETVEGMAAAKKRASYLLSDRFARDVGSTHAALGTSKVEIRNAGDCVWDRFLRAE